MPKVHFWEESEAQVKAVGEVPVDNLEEHRVALVDRVAPADGVAGVAKAAGAVLQGGPVAGSAARRPAAEDLVAVGSEGEAVVRAEAVRREVVAAGYLVAAVRPAAGCVAEGPEVGSRQAGRRGVRVVAGYRAVVLLGAECQAAFAAVPPGAVRLREAVSAAAVEAVDSADRLGVPYRAAVGLEA